MRSDVTPNLTLIGAIRVKIRSEIPIEITKNKVRVRVRLVIWLRMFEKLWKIRIRLRLIYFKNPKFGFGFDWKKKYLCSDSADVFAKIRPALLWTQWHLEVESGTRGFYETGGTGYECQPPWFKWNSVDRTLFSAGKLYMSLFNTLNCNVSKKLEFKRM